MKRLLAIALLVVGCGSGSSGTSAPAPPAAVLSDSAIQAAMVTNLAGVAMSTAAISRPGGVPDIAVSGGVLIVTTTDPASAVSLCRTVAGVTNSPDTGKPLGVLSVAVISGGHSVATCQP